MTDAYDGELVSSFYCRSPDAVTSNDFASIEYLEGWPICTGDDQAHPSGEQVTGPFGPLQARSSDLKLGYPIPISKDGLTLGADSKPDPFSLPPALESPEILPTGGEKRSAVEAPPAELDESLEPFVEPPEACRDGGWCLGRRRATAEPADQDSAAEPPPAELDESLEPFVEPAEACRDDGWCLGRRRVSAGPQSLPADQDSASRSVQQAPMAPSAVAPSAPAPAAAAAAVPKPRPEHMALHCVSEVAYKPPWSPRGHCHGGPVQASPLQASLGPWQWLVVEMHAFLGCSVDNDRSPTVTLRGHYEGGPVTIASSLGLGKG